MSKPKKFKILIYAEGEKEGEETFATSEEREAFEAGFSWGTGLYAGDGASAINAEDKERLDDYLSSYK